MRLFGGAGIQWIYREQNHQLKDAKRYQPEISSDLLVPGGAELGSFVGFVSCVEAGNENTDSKRLIDRFANSKTHGSKKKMTFFRACLIMFVPTDDWRDVCMYFHRVLVSKHLLWSVTVSIWRPFLPAFQQSIAEQDTIPWRTDTAGMLCLVHLHPRIYPSQK